MKFNECTDLVVAREFVKFLELESFLNVSISNDIRVALMPSNMPENAPWMTLPYKDHANSGNTMQFREWAPFPEYPNCVVCLLTPKSP